MILIDTLLQFLKNTKLEKSSETPEGICPNCWGRQEYGGNFYEAIVSEKINLTNLEEKKGWIQAYADKNLTGINLIKNNHENHSTNDETYDCPACKVKYNLKK